MTPIFSSNGVSGKPGAVQAVHIRPNYLISFNGTDRTSTDDFLRVNFAAPHFFSSFNGLGWPKAAKWAKKWQPWQPMATKLRRHQVEPLAMRYAGEVTEETFVEWE